MRTRERRATPQARRHYPTDGRGSVVTNGVRGEQGGRGIPGPRTASGGYDTQLARHILEMAELMTRSTDVDTVLSRLVDECALLVGVDAVGLMLADAGSGVRAVAFSAPSVVAAGALQERTGRGPTVDLLRAGEPVDVVLTATETPTGTDNWPVWADVLRGAGVRRVTCVPLRLIDEPVGGLELYSFQEEDLLPLARQVAAAFAGLAVVVVRHAAELDSSSMRARQLERALEVRVVVEQAKGFLCGRGFEDPDVAFEALRRFARRSRQRVETVSAAVMSGDLAPGTLRGAGHGA